MLASQSDATPHRFAAESPADLLGQDIDVSDEIDRPIEQNGAVRHVWIIGFGWALDQRCSAGFLDSFEAERTILQQAEIELPRPSPAPTSSLARGRS